MKSKKILEVYGKIITQHVHPLFFSEFEFQNSKSPDCVLIFLSDDINLINLNHFLTPKYKDTKFYVYAELGCWDTFWTPVNNNPERADLEKLQYLNILALADKILVPLEWTKSLIIKYLSPKGFSSSQLEQNINVIGYGMSKNIMEYSRDCYSKLPIMQTKGIYLFDNPAAPSLKDRRDGTLYNWNLSYLIETHRYMEKDYTLHSFCLNNGTQTQPDLHSKIIMNRFIGISNLHPAPGNTNYPFTLFTEITDNLFPQLYAIYKTNTHPFVPNYGPYLEVFKPEHTQDRFVYNYNSMLDTLKMIEKNTQNIPSDISTYVIQHFDLDYKKLIKEIVNV